MDWTAADRVVDGLNFVADNEVAGEEVGEAHGRDFAAGAYGHFLNDCCCTAVGTVAVAEFYFVAVARVAAGIVAAVDIQTMSVVVGFS